MPVLRFPSRILKGQCILPNLNQSTVPCATRSISSRWTWPKIKLCNGLYVRKSNCVSYVLFVILILVIFSLWQESTSFPNEAHIQDCCNTGSNLSYLDCSPWNLNCSSKLYLAGQCYWFLLVDIFKKNSARRLVVCLWIWLFLFQLPIYLVVALGCYGLFMVGFGLMFFPTCPQEAILLQQVSYFSLRD